MPRPSLLASSLAACSLLTLAPLASAQTPTAKPPAATPPAATPAKPAAPLARQFPAPDVGIDEWATDKPKHPNVLGAVVDGVGDAVGGGDLAEQMREQIEEQMAKVNQSIAKAKPRDATGDLEKYQDKVVLIHVIDWANASTSTDQIELLKQLLEANADRDLQCLGIMEKGDASDKRASTAKVSWPIARASFQDNHSPYLRDRSKHSMFVIGRGGELVWHGSAMRDRQAFLQAVSRALHQLPVQRLAHPTAPELRDALASYYDGDLRKALAKASRAKSAATRAKNDTLRQQAEALTYGVGATELTWLQRMREHAGRRKEFDDYIRYVDALDRALPRGSGKEAKAHEKELSKKGKNLMRLREQRAWVDCHAHRPPLFPVRADRDGDRFRARLEKFLKQARHADAAIERAQELLDRYRTTAK